MDKTDIARRRLRLADDDIWHRYNKRSNCTRINLKGIQHVGIGSWRRDVWRWFGNAPDMAGADCPGLPVSQQTLADARRNGYGKIRNHHARRPVPSPWAGGAIVTAGAATFTAWSEWYNAYQINDWGYTASMPMTLDIGLAPLLQWLILLPLTTVVYRALCLRLFARHSTPSPAPT